MDPQKLSAIDLSWKSLAAASPIASACCVLHSLVPRLTFACPAHQWQLALADRILPPPGPLHTVSYVLQGQSPQSALHQLI